MTALLVLRKPWTSPAWHAYCGILTSRYSILPSPFSCGTAGTTVHHQRPVGQALSHTVTWRSFFLLTLAPVPTAWTRPSVASYTSPSPFSLMFPRILPDASASSWRLAGRSSGWSKRRTKCRAADEVGRVDTVNAILVREDVDVEERAGDASRLHRVGDVRARARPEAGVAERAAPVERRHERVRLRREHVRRVHARRSRS